MNASSDDTYWKVEALVREMVGPRPKIAPETRLYHDLDILGDEAWDFLETFSAVFDVDLSGMDVRPYFGTELEGVPRMFAALREKLNRRYIPLTIQHFADVAESGRWFAPD